jgi:hypothetical protein
MVAILILSWPGQNYSVMKNSRIKPLTIIMALIAGIVLPISFGAPVKELIGISDGQGTAKENLFTIQGLNGIDLDNGSFIFVLIGTDCTHCRESVLDFNRIARKTDLPKIIALSADSEEQRASFVEELKPVFPVMGISEDDFYRVLGTGLTPRSILVVKQHVLKTWDEEVPSVDGIKQALGK